MVLMRYRFLTLLFLSYILFFPTMRSYALFLLSDVMSKEEQRRTGVSNLNANQKNELEKWLNENFTLKTQEEKLSSAPVSLSVNINGGKQLRLSDGSLYEVAPSDTKYSASWITPFIMKIEMSSDPNYPCKLTNTATGTSVKARQIEPPNS